MSSKATIAALESVIANTSTCLEECRGTRQAKVILARLAENKTIVAQVLDTLPKRTRLYTKVKKSLVALGNSLDGLHDGVASRNLSVAVFRKCLANTNNKFLRSTIENLEDVKVALASRSDNGTITGLASSVNSNLEFSQQTGADVVGSEQQTSLDKTTKKLVIRSTDFKEALSVLKGKVVLSADSLEDMQNPVLQELRRVKQVDENRARSEEDSLRRKIEHIQSLKTRMPIRIKGNYQILKLPIVPIFETPPAADRQSVNAGALSKYVLSKLGVNHVVLGHYLILEDQFVLALNHKDAVSFLSEQQQGVDAQYQDELKTFRTDTKRLKELGLTKEEIAVRHRERPKRKRIDVNPVDFAKSILNVLNEHSSVQYVLVSEKYYPNPRNTDILLFWLMPRRTLSALLSKGWKKLSRWGLPW